MHRLTKESTWTDPYGEETSPEKAKLLAESNLRMRRGALRRQEILDARAARQKFALPLNSIHNLKPDAALKKARSAQGRQSVVFTGKPTAVSPGEGFRLSDNASAIKLERGQFGEITVTLPGIEHADLKRSPGRLASREVSVRSFDSEEHAELFARTDELTGTTAEETGMNGPMIELQPHGSTFKEPVAVSFDMTKMVDKWSYWKSGSGSDGVLLVLRQAHPSAPWLPLAEDETLDVDENGVATVRVKSFSRFTAKLFQGPKAALNAAKAATNAVLKAADEYATKAVNKVANADPQTVRMLAKYGAMAAGAALGVADAATGGVVGLALPGARDKLSAIRKNPEIVQDFAKELQGRLEVEGSLGGVLKNSLKEMAIEKGLDKLKPILEDPVNALGIEWETFTDFALSLNNKDLWTAVKTKGPKQFLIEHQPEMVWRLLKDEAESESHEVLDRDTAIPHLQAFIDKDTFKVVFAAAGADAAKMVEKILDREDSQDEEAEKVARAAIAGRKLRFEIPDEGGKLSNVDIDVDITEEDEILLHVDVTVPKSDIYVIELTRQGNEAIFDSAAAVIHGQIEGTMAEDLFQFAPGQISDGQIADGRISDGPMLQCMPHGCEFSAPARIFFDVSALVEDEPGGAFFVAMRKESKTSPWSPLVEGESLTVTESGMAVLELRSFCWIKCWRFAEAQSKTVVGLITETLTEPGQEKVDHEEAAARGLVGVAEGEAGYPVRGVAAVSVATKEGRLALKSKPDLAEEAVTAAADTKRTQMEEAAAKSLVDAAERGDQKEIKRQLAAGADYDTKADDGEPLLTKAAAGGHTPAVQTLVQAGANIEQPNSKGVTPLMAAAENGFTDVAGQLLDSGADIDKGDDNGDTALSLAAKAGQANTVAELIDAGADLDKPNAQGDTARTVAAKSGHGDVAQQLLDADPDSGERKLKVDAPTLDELLSSVGLESKQDVVVRYLADLDVERSMQEYAISCGLERKIKTLAAHLAELHSKQQGSTWIVDREYRLRTLLLGDYARREPEKNEAIWPSSVQGYREITEADFQVEQRRDYGIVFADAFNGNNPLRSRKLLDYGDLRTTQNGFFQLGSSEFGEVDEPVADPDDTNMQAFAIQTTAYAAQREKDRTEDGWEAANRMPALVGKPDMTINPKRQVPESDRRTLDWDAEESRPKTLENEKMPEDQMGETVAADPSSLREDVYDETYDFQGEARAGMQFDMDEQNVESEVLLVMSADELAEAEAKWKESLAKGSTEEQEAPGTDPETLKQLYRDDIVDVIKNDTDEWPWEERPWKSEQAISAWSAKFAEASQSRSVSGAEVTAALAPEFLQERLAPDEDDIPQLTADYEARRAAEREEDEPKRRAIAGRTINFQGQAEALASICFGGKAARSWGSLVSQMRLSSSVAAELEAAVKDMMEITEPDAAAVAQSLPAGFRLGRSSLMFAVMRDLPSENESDDDEPKKGLVPTYPTDPGWPCWGWCPHASGPSLASRNGFDQAADAAAVVRLKAAAVDGDSALVRKILAADSAGLLTKPPAPGRLAAADVALVAAAAWGRGDVVQALVEAGGRLDQVLPDFRRADVYLPKSGPLSAAAPHDHASPLIAAAFANHPVVVSYLLKAGADWHLLDKPDPGDTLEVMSADGRQRPCKCFYHLAFQTIVNARVCGQGR